MSPEELAEAIQEVKRVAPIPGDFIVIRLAHHLGPAASRDIAATLRSVFPLEQRILVIDKNTDLDTHFGKCLNCGHDINPT